jgi:tocopherol cyclase
MYAFRRIFNPEIYQGKYKRSNYFEGWYYKIIDSTMEHAYAVIPGVSMGRGNGDSHAFVQVLDAFGCNVNYIKYDISSFKFSEKRFEAEIEDNYFSNSEIHLNVKNESFSMNGRLLFKNTVPYPKTLLRPGIMGPYSYVPFMECYHGIVSIHHDIIGQMSISGGMVDFSDGYGYIEKDWGMSFPEAWIWLQSNHFSTNDVSLMFSTAKIPWLGRYFTGLISFLRIGSKIYLFSTYTKAKIVMLEYRGNCLKVLLEDRNFKMEITAEHSDGGILKAPKNGLMKRDVLESINATVKVILSEKAGGILFEGDGTHTGLEIVSDIFQYYNAQG